MFKKPDEIIFTDKAVVQMVGVCVCVGVGVGGKTIL